MTIKKYKKIESQDVLEFEVNMKENQNNIKIEKKEYEKTMMIEKKKIKVFQCIDNKKELLDYTDQYLVDNVIKKVASNHKKDVAITIIQDAASSDKYTEIVWNQTDNSSIGLDNIVHNKLKALEKILLLYSIQVDVKSTD
ncbi:hypothetical protein C2G38_2169493 [Gigaspora rosea]|uniref:Uncharacterized protein n=1 Tax=Gigaspora rosea TaxID=44941 RepID=A0A397VQ56_9GLOM|nr:hypothetical protein C2G38_2169493 [Gigaspora rosea]